MFLEGGGRNTGVSPLFDIYSMETLQDGMHALLKNASGQGIFGDGVHCMFVVTFLLANFLADVVFGGCFLQKRLVIPLNT
jgi:hypothetical protein